MVSNPFSKRESHSARSLGTYKAFTLVTWLLVVVFGIMYFFTPPNDTKHSHRIWVQNDLHPTPFSLNSFVTSIYWIILLIAQVGYVSQLFSSDSALTTAAANVGSHFILNNLLVWAHIMLWTRGHFWQGELILVINFFNNLLLYLNHTTSPLLIHVPAVSGPFAWSFVALFWNGAAMVHAHTLAARIVANIFIWDFLILTAFCLVAFKDYTFGAAMTLLTLSLAISQLSIKVVALQWIFAFVIFGVSFFGTLAVAIPGALGRELDWRQNAGGEVVDEDRERAPLLDDN